MTKSWKYHHHQAQHRFAVSLVVYGLRIFIFSLLAVLSIALVFGALDAWVSSWSFLVSSWLFTEPFFLLLPVVVQAVLPLLFIVSLFAVFFHSRRINFFYFSALYHNAVSLLGKIPVIAGLLAAMIFSLILLFFPYDLRSSLAGFAQNQLEQLDKNPDYSVKEIFPQQRLSRMGNYIIYPLSQSKTWIYHLSGSYLNMGGHGRLVKNSNGDLVYHLDKGYTLYPSGRVQKQLSKRTISIFSPQEKGQGAVKRYLEFYLEILSSPALPVVDHSRTLQHSDKFALFINVKRYGFVFSPLFFLFLSYFFIRIGGFRFTALGKDIWMERLLIGGLGILGILLILAPFLVVIDSKMEIDWSSIYYLLGWILIVSLYALTHRFRYFFIDIFHRKYRQNDGKDITATGKEHTHGSSVLWRFIKTIDIIDLRFRNWFSMFAVHKLRLFHYLGNWIITGIAMTQMLLFVALVFYRLLLYDQLGSEYTNTAKFFAIQVLDSSGMVFQGSVFICITIIPIIWLILKRSWIINRYSLGGNDPRGLLGLLLFLVLIYNGAMLVLHETLSLGWQQKGAILYQTINTMGTNTRTAYNIDSDKVYPMADALHILDQERMLYYSWRQYISGSLPLDKPKKKAAYTGWLYGGIIIDDQRKQQLISAKYGRVSGNVLNMEEATISDLSGEMVKTKYVSNYQILFNLDEKTDLDHILSGMGNLKYLSIDRLFHIWQSGNILLNQSQQQAIMVLFQRLAPFVLLVFSLMAYWFLLTRFRVERRNEALAFGLSMLIISVGVLHLGGLAMKYLI